MVGSMSRQKGKKEYVFFELEVEDVGYGRIVIELDYEHTPITSENFCCLCTGEKCKGRIGKPLHYKGTEIDSIHPGYLVSGGKLAQFKFGMPTAVESIYGEKFKDESFENKHDRAGVASMDSDGVDNNTSEFMITLKKTPEFDKINVAFDRVVKGFEILQRISDEAEPTDKEAKGLKVVISECGES